MPSLLRPLFLLGAVVIGVAVISWLINPAFHRTPLGLAVLVIAILAGLAAIVRDLVSFAREVKEFEKKEDG